MTAAVWHFCFVLRNKKLMAPQKMTKAEAKKQLGIKNGNYMKTLVKKCAKCAKMREVIR